MKTSYPTPLKRCSGPERTGATRLRLEPGGWFHQPTLVHQTEWRQLVNSVNGYYSHWWRDSRVEDLTEVAAQEVTNPATL